MKKKIFLKQDVFIINNNKQKYHYFYLYKDKIKLIKISDVNFNEENICTFVLPKFVNIIFEKYLVNIFSTRKDLGNKTIEIIYDVTEWLFSNYNGSLELNDNNQQVIINNILLTYNKNYYVEV